MRRTLLALSAVTGLVVLVAAPAYAHVTVNPNSAAKGSYAKLTFRVPNETDDATTAAFEINFPTDHPLASVSVEPVPGWSFAVAKETLAKPIESDDGAVTDAVTKITWTGGAIAPGEFQEFSVSVGPLPTDADSLTFKALQTYDNGSIVRWIDPTPTSGAEPDHPAPVLSLTAATSSAPTVTKHDVDQARSVSYLALGAGILGVLIAAGALRAASRKAV